MKSIKAENISLKIIKEIIKEINKESFNNLLVLPKIKMGISKTTKTNPAAMGYYIYKDNTIYMNFKAIEETKIMLHKFSKLNIKNQNLDLDIQDNIIQAVTYVLEHELCHCLIYKYLPDTFSKEISHGPTFRKLVKHLFGHNWGDFAFVHIGQYIQSGFRKKKFFEMLNDPHNYDDKYREEVYKRLWKATTLKNFYTLFFTNNKTRKNKRLE